MKDTATNIPTPSHWTASIPNRVPALMQAIEEMDRWLEQSGADSNARFHARLAVEELGTNTIKYGYDDPHEHTIVLHASARKRKFRICVEDDGHQFNPCTAPEPDGQALEQRPGGCGISLVRRLLTAMDYERKDGRNIVCVEVPRPAHVRPHSSEL